MKLIAKLAAISALTICSFAQAGEMSSDQIVCALNPACARPVTRGLTVTGQNSTSDPLSIDLYINFAYNSADILPEARITLNKLGEALRDPRLEKFSFKVGGHTDARGGEEFNRKLSERRAAAVRDYLAANYGVSPDRLAAQGFGRSQLLLPDMPFDSANRRVQIINVSEGVASK